MSFFVIRPSHLLVVTGLLFTVSASAQTTASGADFSGIWQLNDKESDNAGVITQRLHAEKKHEQAPSSQSASTGSSDTSAPTPNSGFGGRGGGRGMGGMGGGGHGMGGGGHGMGGGGHGMGGGRHGNQNAQDSSSGSSSAPPKDPTPPLLADDSFLNIQQTRSGLRVDFNNADRLDTRFDGVEHPSLNSNARVQTRLTPDGMTVSMAFDDGTQLDQSWVRSPDGHHLTVTETWKPNSLKEPIIFKRSYDRLDL
ncbi:hypothetical protein [Dyella acidisoli]|uniref:Lipocalin-like domain-containing protein n=1 Tax=Dyella acidisoli TaxID=1867834 RepID=A0ABQ5XTY5_9GAMM|nr:hypothetical protein [Dyella acidisoli]GLQ94202.1 hypothetical protein GCM10007901_31530 [Dyella acidisoli]